MKLFLLLLAAGPLYGQQAASREATTAPDVLLSLKKGPGAALPSSASTRSGASTADDSAGEYEILVKNPDLLNLSVSSTTAASWETNPAFSPNTAEESLVFAQTASVRWSQVFAEKWLADLSAQQLFYRYDQFDTLDFDRTSIRGSFSWGGLADVENVIVKGWVPSVGAEWFRLNDAGKWNAAILDNTFLTASLQRVFQLADQHRAVLGLATSVSVDASVEQSQRDEHSVTAAWLARWAPRWETTAYGRLALYDYESHQDWNTSVGALVEYAPADWCRLGLSLSATFNESNLPAFDYENVSLGASVNLRISF